MVSRHVTYVTPCPATASSDGLLALAPRRGARLAFRLANRPMVGCTLQGPTLDLTAGSVFSAQRRPNRLRTCLHRRPAGRPACWPRYPHGMDDGRLHRSGLRIIDGGLAGAHIVRARGSFPRSRSEALRSGATPPSQGLEPAGGREPDRREFAPAPALLRHRMSVLSASLPGMEEPALLILPVALADHLTAATREALEVALAAAGRAALDEGAT